MTVVLACTAEKIYIHKIYATDLVQGKNGKIRLKARSAFKPRLGKSKFNQEKLIDT